MPSPNPSERPIVTFLTDFGLADPYVAEMKASVLKGCRDAVLIDITHAIAGQDVLAGSLALDRVLRAFPPGTIHVVVIDPGVGTDRRLLLADVAEQTVLAPDNGLITWPALRLGGMSCHELLWRPSGPISPTFHGRDVLGPAAGLIATGGFDGTQLGRLDRPVLLDVRPATSLTEAVVIAIDHFGNCTTNVPAELMTSAVQIAGVGPVKTTYGDVAPGLPVALIGSSGLLELGVRNGSAATTLGLRVGDRVTLHGD